MDECGTCWDRCAALRIQTAHIHSRVLHGEENGPYLLIPTELLSRQQRAVVNGVGSVVDQDRPVLDLQDLNAVSHHRRHGELTQL